MKGLFRVFMEHHFPKVLCLDPEDQGRRPSLMLISFLATFVAVTLFWNLYPSSKATSAEIEALERARGPLTSAETSALMADFTTLFATVFSAPPASLEDVRDKIRAILAAPTGFMAYFDATDDLMRNLTVNLDNAIYRPWTIITHAFSHMDWGHLAGNSVAFFLFAPKVYAFLGPKRFLGLYLFGALLCFAAETSRGILAGKTLPPLSSREAALRALFPDDLEEVRMLTNTIASQSGDPHLIPNLMTAPFTTSPDYPGDGKTKALPGAATPASGLLRYSSLGMLGSSVPNPLLVKEQTEATRSSLSLDRRELPCLGASGSVMAIVTSYACFFPRDMVVYQMFRIPVLFAALMYIVGDLSGVLHSMSSKMHTITGTDSVDGAPTEGPEGVQVANMGHLGGAVAGILYAMLIWRTPLMARINPSGRGLPVVELLKRRSGGNTIAFK